MKNLTKGEVIALIYAIAKKISGEQATGISSITWNGQTNSLVFTMSDGSQITTPITLDASDIAYSNATSGLSANVVQDAIDEVNNKINAARGIISLTGTEDKPINLFTDTEVGQIYNLMGYIKINDTQTEPVVNKDSLLFYKPSISHGILIGVSIYDYGSDSNISFQTSVRGISGCEFSIDTNGNLSYYTTFNTPTFNGEGTTSRPVGVIYAPTNSGTIGQILQSNGANNAPTWIDMPSTAPTLEEQTIESASWTSLSGQTPYTYSATITLTTTLDTNSIVELINNQPALFATYGFAIGSISGQVATIYSIGQPSESVTLTLEVTG